MVGGSTVRIVAALVCLSICPVNVFSGAQNSVSNYDLRVSLYRPSDGAERAIPGVPLAFSTITVPAPVRTVRQLLLSVHIHADSDAASLFYALNPSVHDPLHLGDKVRVIEIHPTHDSTDALSEGFLFKIYYDEKIVRTLISSRESLPGLIASVSALAPERFADLSVRQAVLGCISSVSD